MFIEKLFLSAFIAVPAYLMGIIASIPVGGVQVEIVKRVLHGRVKQAAMVVLGSVASDLLYGVMAFWGMAAFLENKRALAVFGLAGAVILAVLALVTLRSRGESALSGVRGSLIRSKRLSFATGFSLAVINPIMLLWWLVGAKVAVDLGIVDEFTLKTSLLFLAAGCLGLASYLGVLIVVLRRVKVYVSFAVLHRVNTVLAGVLIVLSFYFMVSSARVLLRC